MMQGGGLTIEPMDCCEAMTKAAWEDHTYKIHDGGEVTDTRTGDDLGVCPFCGHEMPLRRYDFGASKFMEQPGERYGRLTIKDVRDQFKRAAAKYRLAVASVNVRNEPELLVRYGLDNMGRARVTVNRSLIMCRAKLVMLADDVMSRLADRVVR